MNILIPLLALSLVSCSSPSTKNPSTSELPCLQDPVRLKARSDELQVLVNADHDDRENWQKTFSTSNNPVPLRDEIRRKRVGEIFGEGCFSKPEDYAAAALIYQHGNTPDHFFQTYIWSKRGVELGDEKQKHMIALGIDRYLVNIGKKQLFRSQATKPDLKPETCWCLYPVESSFPEKLRKEYDAKSIAKAIQWLKDLNGEKSCPHLECAVHLNPTPKGSVPGLW